MGEYELYFGPFERALLKCIVREFEPRLLGDTPKLSSGLRTLIGQYWQRRFGVSVSQPSMHERLDAVLQLRPWLKIYWPEGSQNLEEMI